MKTYLAPIMKPVSERFQDSDFKFEDWYFNKIVYHFLIFEIHIPNIYHIYIYPMYRPTHGDKKQGPRNGRPLIKIIGYCASIYLLYGIYSDYTSINTL